MDPTRSETSVFCVVVGPKHGGHPQPTCARQDVAPGISRFRRATTSRTRCSVGQERQSRCGVETASSGGGRSGGRFPPMRSGQGPVAQGSGTLSRGCGLVCRSRFDGPSSPAARGSRSEAVNLLGVAEFVRIQIVHECLNSHEFSYEQDAVPINSQPLSEIGTQPRFDAR